MERPEGPLAPAACLAVLAMLLLPGLPTGAGAEPRTVAQFSDGSSEATFYFGPSQGSNQTTVSISRKAVIRSAGLSVEGLPGRDGGYPAQATLRLGTGTVWDFGATQEGTGEMGRQRTFQGGKDSLSFGFPPGGGNASEPGLLLPSAAVVKEASLELSGAPGLLPPRVYSPAASAPRVFWDAVRGTVVQTEAVGNTVDFTSRDPITGSVLGSHRLALRLASGAFVADIQYLPESNRAALLLPGQGVLTVNLTSGQEQEFFSGRDAASLEAMRFSEGSLAVVGRGWAAVRDLVGGAVDQVSATEFPAAAWYEPVAVDYHPESRRLITACRGAFAYYKAVSVFSLEERTVRVFSDSNVTSSLASMVSVPERDSVLLGLSGSGSYNGVENNHAVIALSLADGAVTYVPAFEELQSSSRLWRQGDLVCAIGDSGGYAGSRLVLVDARDWSWRGFSGAGADWSSARSWAYDPAAQRLVTSSTAGGIWVFELDFALEAGAAWQLPEPGEPVPGRVTAVLARGEDIIAGTSNGLTAIGPDGRRRWTIDCGRVDALTRDPVTGRLVAAGLGGLRCEPGYGLWDLRTLELLELDLAGNVPVNVRRSVQLPQDWFYFNLEGIAPCALNGTFFLAVSAYNARGLYELWPNGTFARISTPSTSVGPLALSPDGRTLYAACSGAGLLVLNISTGAQELVTPFSESPLLSPYVLSISVDESGAVLVGQSPGSGYFPGGVSLLERDANGTLETVLGRQLEDGWFGTCARDRAGRRIFIAAGNVLSVINETDGTRTDLSPGIYLNSISWSPESRRLAGAGSGSAIGLGWTDGPPSNVRLDIGGDGSAEWSGPGALEGAVRVDLTSALAGYLAAHQSGQRFTEIPVRVASGSAGLVRLGALLVVYRLSERPDLREALAGYLRALPASEEATVPLNISAVGGGLRLYGLEITYEAGAAPRARSIPEVRADAGATAPRMVDLSKYFTDDLTPPANLSFRLDVRGQPSGVKISLLFGHYLLADARGAAFRGDIRVSVNATDEQGLSAPAELRVSVLRAGEYVPPPPYYGTMAWIFGAVVLAMGLMALRLYLRAFRKRD